jgi:hypothetical protein
MASASAACSLPDSKRLRSVTPPEKANSAIFSVPLGLGS